MFATKPTSIDEVLDQLDEVIVQSVTDNNYLGIFAYVYRRTTAAIKQAIVEKRFEDNERMAHFDVEFANYYLEAYKKYKAGGPVSKSWLVSFEAERDQLSIMQHVILGMNAHINLDLGVTAGLFAPGESIENLKNDFMLVNDILAELIDEMQLKISRNSLLIDLLDRVAKKKDEQVANFSIVKARQQAWRFACNLARMDTAQRQKAIQEADKLVAVIGDRVKNPRTRLLQRVGHFISRLEETEVGLIIEQLKQP